MPPIQISLVRHAQTTMNLEKLIQTRTDALLSEEGVLQAKALGKRMEEEQFTRVITSDRKRAIRTAEIIMEQNTLDSPGSVRTRQDLRLRERDFGDWENRPEAMMFAEAKRLGVKVHQLQPPGGEDRFQFARKGLEFFLELCAMTDDENTSGYEHILVVSHIGWIITLIDTLQKTNNIFEIVAEDRALLDGVPTNTSWTQVTVSPSDDDGFRYKLEFSRIFDDEHVNAA